MRNRRRVANRGHADARIVDGANRRLAATAGSFDPNFTLLHAGFSRAPGSFKSCLLRGEWRPFARAAKTARAGRRLRNQIPFQVGDRDHRIVERRRDVNDSGRNILLLFLAKDLFLAACCCFCHYFLPGAFFLATVARRGPLRVRALVWVRWPRTGSPRR